MNPIYNDGWVKQYCGDALVVLPQLEAESSDLLCTDPPYGLSFMGKDWDKAVPSVDIWRECLRVLKPGAFAFVMCIPRQDCLSRMIVNLQDAGFETGFTSLYWVYASGFPKAQNTGKAVDKRLGAEREIVGYDRQGKKSEGVMAGHQHWAEGKVAITKGTSSLEGSYAGFQPKPAVEVILICMKPLSEKTYVAQALKNGKGVTWLDSARIPIEDISGVWGTSNATCKPTFNASEGQHNYRSSQHSRGRFPANLLVSDDILNDGRARKSGTLEKEYVSESTQNTYGKWDRRSGLTFGDSGSFSRYFDLDKWAETLPFLIVPKASRREKESGLEDFPEQKCRGDYQAPSQFGLLEKIQNSPRPTARNYHPTVKPLKLMAYLITLGSHEGDTVIDPFMGTGTTLLACQKMGRKAIGIDIQEWCCDLAMARCSQMGLGLSGGK